MQDFWEIINLFPKVYSLFFPVQGDPIHEMESEYTLRIHYLNLAVPICRHTGRLCIGQIALSGWRITGNRHFYQHPGTADTALYPVSRGRQNLSAFG